jgi:hypothetical protein
VNALQKFNLFVQQGLGFWRTFSSVCALSQLAFLCNKQGVPTVFPTAASGGGAFGLAKPRHPQSAPGS